MKRPTDVPTPGPGQESVWDNPRPPRIEEVPAVVRVEFAGEVVAESDHALRVLETASPPTVYLPPDDVAMEHLEPSHKRSFCEWKGRARYWSLRVGDRTSPDAAWGYPSPTADFSALAGYVSFFPGRVDACWIGDQEVTPQAGDFYGGWVTPNILGPMKGEPGTEFW